MLCCIGKGKTERTILLIRHGQAESNVNPDVYDYLGDQFVPLTSIGEEQCRQLQSEFLSKRLQNENFVLWQSPYIRARNTAKIILEDETLQKSCTKIIEEIALAEMNFGLFFGNEFQDWVESGKRGPIEDRLVRLMNTRKRLQTFFFKMLGGESPFDVFLRVQPIVKKIKEMKEKTHVIVSHGVTLKCLAMAFMSYKPEMYKGFGYIPNCSVYEIIGETDYGLTYCEESSDVEDLNDSMERRKGLLLAATEVYFLLYRCSILKESVHMVLNHIEDFRKRSSSRI